MENIDIDKIAKELGISKEEAEAIINQMIGILGLPEDIIRELLKLS